MLQLIKKSAYVIYEWPLGFEWRVTAHALTAPRYDFALAVAPVSSLALEDRGMDDCSSHLEIIES